MKDSPLPPAQSTKYAELVAICVGAMLKFIAVSMSAPLIPLAALEMGASPSMMGLILGVSNIGALFCAMPTGFLIRRIGTRLPMVLSGLAMGVSCLFLYLYPTLIGLFVGLTFFGITRTVNAIAIQAHVGALGGRGRAGMNFGWYGTAISVGQMIGPAVAGVLIDQSGTRITWLAMAGPCVLASILLPFFISSGRFPQEPSAKSQALIVRVRELLNPAATIGILTSFIIIFALGSRRVFFPVYLRSLSYSATAIGLLISIRGLVELFSRMSIGPVLRVLKGRFNAVIVCLALLAAGIGSISLCRSMPTLVLNIVAIGLGFGLSMPLSQATVFDSARPSDRGLAMGLRMTGNRLASLASPLVFGPAVQYLGMAPAFGLGGFVVLGVAILFFILRRRRGDFIA